MLDSMFLISMLFSIHFHCCQFCLIQCFHFSCNNFQYSPQFFVTIFYIKFNINVLMFPSNSVLPHSMFFFLPLTHFSVWVKVLQGIEIIVVSTSWERMPERVNSNEDLFVSENAEHTWDDKFIYFSLWEIKNFVFEIL